MQHTTIAVDLSKSVFQIAVSHRPGRVDAEYRLRRPQMHRFFATQPTAVVVMEACGSAHYWGRALECLGHTVRLLPPHDVHRYVRRTKTDRADAKALLEAARNDEIHAVPVKTVTQQALTSLHRLRSTWVATRTARLNILRGLLREFGVTIPTGAGHVRPQVQAVLADPDAPVPDALRASCATVLDELQDLETRITAVDQQLAALARHVPLVAQLQTIPGIGLLTATALVASVGHVQRFPSARHFASSLGLTPKEHSSGTRRRLGAISKQGDRYLRMLLMHGARALLWSAARTKTPDTVRAWARQVHQRRGHNIAAAAVANKLARIVWRVWQTDRGYEARPVAA